MAASKSAKVWQIAQSDYIKLIPILALAIFVAFIPNLNYPYPVHIDEWRHIAHINSLIRAGDITYPDPFSGEMTGTLVSRLEVGYHLLFGMFAKISGIPLTSIARYMPSIIFAITVLSVYILARREGFGWEAAFFTCLIPTTIGIMGPAFFAPVALGLMFVPLSLFLIFYLRTPWSYLLLFLFTVFLINTHTTSAICLLIVLIPCALFYLRSDFKHGLKLMLIWIVPFVLTLPLTYELIVSTASSFFIQKPLPPYHAFPRVIQDYGYIPVGLGLLGTFMLWIKGGTTRYCLATGVLAFTLMASMYYTLHYGHSLIYLRGLLYMMLMLSIVAGTGLMTIKNLELPTRLSLPRVIRKVGYPLSIILIAITLFVGIQARLITPYYHMIDEQDFETFVWIRDNVDEQYQMAILDPWKATAFTAITGKYVFARTHVAPTKIDEEASAFLEGGCVDTNYLRDNGISLIYNREPCSNPDLVEVRQHVYILE